MEGNSLKSRAIAFAFCVGAVSFILAMLAGAAHGGGRGFYVALVIAIICAVMSWASAERALAGVAEAIDAAIARLASAAEGDLLSPTPEPVATALPELSRSLDGLLAQVRGNLESVHTLAMYDPVTALANRTNFRREAAAMLRELPVDTLSALLFIDLDKFKAVNDSMGHAQGDHLLAMVANRLRAVVAPDGQGVPRFARPPLIGRLAGDEFTILVPEIAEPDAARTLARDILYALTEPFDLAGHQVEIGASIGIALRPAHGRALTDLMRAADAAMYHAKDSGRGQVQQFSAALADRLETNLQIERDLRHALDHGEFALVFQPQVDLASGRTVGAEALLRWEHPLLGTRLPQSFIGRAEDSGLIAPIGDWVIDAAAAAAARWADHAGVARLAINVSPREIARPEFFSRLRAVLARHGAPASRLEIEITETLAMECGETVLAALAALRAEGVTIAIDDFGTGYSNLARLRALPLDKVKIDRSLIVDIAESEEARNVVHAVIGLIHGVGCLAVAEGVETEEQRAVLAVIGCDMIQGYAVARPMAEAAFGAWLNERAATPVVA
ncbi:putative bifunctional diguanylate cyclase/phosphodiesterase [Sphingomonas flavalba]|uniref:putative bifunctional diguanylate cyclase/phosphodiesterase n=1 Tax=Sphingomonas flavalba TaxID=2559804 RepID=UPI0039DF9267